MTLSEALKKVKQYNKRMNTQRGRIEDNSIVDEGETPVYSLDELWASNASIAANIGYIMSEIQRSNAVTILQYNGKQCSVSALIHLKSVTLPDMIYDLQSAKTKSGRFRREEKQQFTYDIRKRDTRIASLEKEIEDITQILDEHNFTHVIEVELG